MLHIDGLFDGDIVSDNIVQVGKHGILKGEVKAQKLVVAGKFFGNAECEAIELMDGGETEGRLTSASLSVDANSSFQGESILKKSSTTPSKFEMPDTNVRVPGAGWSDDKDAA